MNKSLILALCTAAALGACGGGDDDPAPAPAPTAAVPDSASQSVDGFVAYLSALVGVGSSADTLEPVDVSNVTPPVDDTADPRIVD